MSEFAGVVHDAHDAAPLGLQRFVGSEELLKVRKFGAVAFVLPTPVLVSLGRRRGESRERQPDTKHG